MPFRRVKLERLQISSLVLVLLIYTIKMPICVLIIDDDEIFCGFLAEILKHRGFQVTSTSDALAGYDMALHNPYDLLIIDVRMPGVLGTELAESLRKEKPQAKIILISAFADESLSETAARLGVALVSKPFSAHRLYDIIAMTIGPPV
ncbi:MAG TPA: response regulator [Candidatus Binatia bacterium]